MTVLNVRYSWWAAMASKYGEALAERRELIGFANQTDLVSALDKLLADFPAFQKFSQQWLSRLERDRNGDIISAAHGPKLRALAHALQWSIADMQEATGVDLGVPNGWVAAGNPTHKVKDGWVISGRGEKPLSDDDVRSSTRVRIPVYALAAAGAGVWTEEDIVTHIDVEPEIATRPNRVTFQVNGTSMEPTLDSGDYIHVDLADNDIRHDKVYVVLILNNGIVVKRARVYDDNTIQLVSDNHKHPAVRPDEARIIGRVYAVTPKTRRL